MLANITQVSISVWRHFLSNCAYENLSLVFHRLVWISPNKRLGFKRQGGVWVGRHVYVDLPGPLRPLQGRLRGSGSEYHVHLRQNRNHIRQSKVQNQTRQKWQVLGCRWGVSCLEGQWRLLVRRKKADSLPFLIKSYVSYNPSLISRSKGPCINNVNIKSKILDPPSPLVSSLLTLT